MTTEFERRIEAAKKRLGDLKALHTRWAEGDPFYQQDTRGLINEFEQIAYSAVCYLDGIPGVYLPPASTGAGGDKHIHECVCGMLRVAPIGNNECPVCKAATPSPPRRWSLRMTDAELQNRIADEISRYKVTASSHMAAAHGVMKVLRAAGRLAPALQAEVERTAAAKDAAYSERNQLVALLARLYPSGVRPTYIEGWDPDWHGCVYIDLPTGQASWHYHTSEAGLFGDLPAYKGDWDGHSTEEKYRRIAALAASPNAGRISAADLERAAEARFRKETELLYGDVTWRDMSPDTRQEQIDAMRAALEILGLAIEGDAP